MNHEELRKKVQYGDYVTLAKMLNISHPAAKMRFLRGNAEAVEAIKKIVTDREELINTYKKDENI